MSAPPKSCRAQRPALAPGALPHTRGPCSRLMRPAAAPCMQRNRDRRQRAGAASGRRLLRPAAAAAVQQGNPLDLEPTLVLAGFYIEEIAGVRQLLDEIGAAEVKVVPTTPERLHRPLGQVLATPEPRWDQPVPGDWEAGGGWGQQPTVLMAGLDQQGANILLDLLEESLGASVCPAFATPENLGTPLGEVLAAGLKLWRQSGGSTSSGGGGAAAASAPSAAAAGMAADGAPESDAAEEGVQFTEQLPSLEQLLSQPAGQATGAAEGGIGSKAEAGGSDGGSGSSAANNATATSPTAGGMPTASSSSVAKARQVGASLAPEVVQAEFSERPAASAAAASEEEEEEEEGVPLDLIDAIASGSEPQGPPLAAAAAGTPAPPAVPAVRAEEGAEADSMSSEELLAAARAALGLDSAGLQRMVDEAAAKAAAATGMPFVPGGAAGSSGSVASSSGSGFPGAPPEAAAPAAAAAGAPAPAVRPAPPSSSENSSPKPWETAAPAAAGLGSKGFGRPAPPSRKAAKAARRSAGGSIGTAGQPTAAAQAAPASSQNAAADAQQRPVQEKQQQQGEQPADEERVLPPADQFVLSRAQLKEVTEQHGLDFEELLAGLQQRGIELSD